MAHQIKLKNLCNLDYFNQEGSKSSSGGTSVHIVDEGIRPLTLHLQMQHKKHYGHVLRMLVRVIMRICWHGDSQQFEATTGSIRIYQIKHIKHNVFMGI